MKYIFAGIALVFLCGIYGCSGNSSSKNDKSTSVPSIKDKILPDLPIIDCQKEIKFSGKPDKEVQEFWVTDQKKYELSGGWNGAYSGDGVKNNCFSPQDLSPGIHYIKYRDRNNYRQPKRIKIRIISLTADPVECTCDDDYRVKCSQCKGLGKEYVQVECSKCDGSGKVRSWFKKKDCPNCHIGEVTVGKECIKCKGKGWVDCDKH